MEKTTGYIQLPYGYIENENDEKLHLNIPDSQKKKIIFDKLPYLAQLNNPAIDNVVKGKESEDLAIQKYLLATDLLEDTIQNNLDMIVNDEEFNNAGIRRVLDTKFPAIMNKATATNFMFRDKAKFDIQNPVIGTLYNQLLTNKQREKIELEAIGKAPSIKDIDIKKKLDDLNKFNLGVGDKKDDDDNNDNGGLRPPPSPFAPLTPPTTPSTLSETQRFLLGSSGTSDSSSSSSSSSSGSNERILAGLTTTSTPKSLSFSQAITKVFPKTRRELIPLQSISEENQEETEDFDITESSTISIPDQTQPINLEFFTGGEKNKNKLLENATKKSGILNESNRKFIDYLSSRFRNYILSKNKMKIHLESGQIFHDNNLTTESLYDFLKVQQDVTKKELDINIPISNDFSIYVRETLTHVVDDDFDLQTNETSKFLFYNFNMVRQMERLNPIPIRYSEIVENEHALQIVQSRNWQYFIETLLHISNNELNEDSFDLKNDEAFEDYLIIGKTAQNLKYCKNFYEEDFNDIAYFLHKKIKETPGEIVEKMEEDLANEKIYYKRIKEIESHAEFLMIFNNFYFKTGRFPGNHVDLMVVLPGVKPSFV